MIICYCRVLSSIGRKSCARSFVNREQDRAIPMREDSSMESWPMPSMIIPRLGAKSAGRFGKGVEQKDKARFALDD